jgi:hypothetical protein
LKKSGQTPNYKVYIWLTDEWLGAYSNTMDKHFYDIWCNKPLLVEYDCYTDEIYFLDTVLLDSEKIRGSNYTHSKDKWFRFLTPSEIVVCRLNGKI